MLIADGGSDGGELRRLVSRHAQGFQESGIARLEERRDCWLEAFRLENRPRRGGTERRRLGRQRRVHLLREARSSAAPRWSSTPNCPGYDELDVYDGASTGPARRARRASRSAASSRTRRATRSRPTAGSRRRATSTKALCWSPTFSYRYAHFDGDDPGTAQRRAVPRDRLRLHGLWLVVPGRNHRQLSADQRQPEQPPCCA